MPFMSHRSPAPQGQRALPRIRHRRRIQTALYIWAADSVAAQHCCVYVVWIFLFYFIFFLWAFTRLHFGDLQQLLTAKYPKFVLMLLGPTAVATHKQFRVRTVFVPYVIFLLNMKTKDIKQAKKWKEN